MRFAIICDCVQAEGLRAASSGLCPLGLIRGGIPHTSTPSHLLTYMVEYTTDEFSIREIADRFSVMYQTARTDLMHLADSGYLGVRKKGKAFFYQVRDDWLENTG